jgi:V/A-type H+-transporting ATPase subunit C
MSSQSANAYLNARVSVLADQLFSPPELERLSRMSLDELSQRFNLSPLQIEDLAVGTRLRAVEGALIYTLISELSVLIRPMYGEARELVTHWARKFELFNLKALIRGKLSGLDEQEIHGNLHDLPEFLALPHQRLLRTESVQELLRQLEQGPYRAIASQARQVYEEQREPFALEATIDQRYFAGLVKRVRQLSGGDLKETQKVVGLQLDHINLLWLLRYRFTYGLSPTEAYYQLVPSILHLHRERLLKLVNLPSFDRVIEGLPAPLDQWLEGAEHTTAVEARMEALTAEKTRSVVAHSPSPVARALAFLILREMDLKRLFSIIQGRMLGLEGEVLRVALGLGQGGHGKAAAHA